MSLFYGDYTGGQAPARAEYGQDSPTSAPGSPPSSRAWQAGLVIAFAVGLVGFLALRAARERGESIAHIRSAPVRFDGSSVLVRGRVGEAFPMGGSWAFYLHQGRDTIVVFSRHRTPVKNRTIAVHGSVSIGYLDGQPRPALFESDSER